MKRRRLLSVGSGVLLAVALGYGGYRWKEERDLRAWGASLPRVPDSQGKHPELLERLRAAQAGAERLGDPVEELGQLARLYLANGYMAEAEQALVLRVRMAPDEARWHYWLAGLWSSYGQLEKAVPEYETVVRLDATYLPAQIRLGDALTKANRVAEARRVFEQALTSDPKQVHALLGLGRLAMGQQDWDVACQRLEQATVIDPQFSAAWSLLATAALHAAKPERAEAARRRAAVLGRFRDVDDPWAAELLDDCYDSYRLQVAASTLAATGSGRGALGPLLRAVRLWPEDGKAHRQLGRVYLKIREFEAAERSFERARALLADDPSLYIDLVDVYRNKRDLRAGARIVAEGLAHFPESSGLNYEQGMLLVAAQRHGEAIPYLEKARSLETENIEAAIKLVPLYFRERRFDEGARVLQEALLREPNNVPLLLMSVRYQTEHGDPAVARTHWARARDYGAEAEALRELGADFERRFGEPLK